MQFESVPIKIWILMTKLPKFFILTDLFRKSSDLSVTWQPNRTPLIDFYNKMKNFLLKPLRSREASLRQKSITVTNDLSTIQKWGFFGYFIRVWVFGLLLVKIWLLLLSTFLATLIQIYSFKYQKILITSVHFQIDSF